MDAETCEPDHLCLICLASTEGVGPASIRKVMAGAEARGISLSEALRLSAEELGGAFGIARKVASIMAGLRSPLLGGQAVLDWLERVEAQPVFEGSEYYPARISESLRESAPPVMFIVGEPGILARPSIAVVGSRKPSEAAAAAARSFAGDMAAAGAAVVSGGAVGIDTAAHKGAIERGATVVVPPVGIGRFRWRGIADEEFQSGRWCLLGQFPPLEGWKNRYALIRNRTIVAASEAVVAFEPRDSGGTWHGCVTALRMRKPLFVATARDSVANRHALERLVRHGAVVLDIRCMPDHPAFKDLLEGYRLPPVSAQLPLFDPLDGSQ